MTTSSEASTISISRDTKTTARDSSIDTMRGIAILMVIGIHSLPQPLGASWEVLVDAALRPSVPIFLFASGYLTGRSGRVPLWKRIRTVLIPYAVAFIAAYSYMALHNPAMNHHLPVLAARFGLAYVFVYYYVFVYIGCVVALWCIMQAWNIAAPGSSRSLVFLLLLSIVIGLTFCSYIDPLMSHLGFSESSIEEVRLRDIPFWLSFASLGMMFGIVADHASIKHMRAVIAGFMSIAYLVYGAVRLFHIGDSADYDSVAFFAYAALFCVLLLDRRPNIRFLAIIGSGSYFIYLWHIFVVMALRDHTSLRDLGLVTDFALTYVATAAVSIAVLYAVRALAPPPVVRWLGA